MDTGYSMCKRNKEELRVIFIHKVEVTPANIQSVPKGQAFSKDCINLFDPLAFLRVDAIINTISMMDQWIVRAKNVTGRSIPRS